ncbi:hypothetical protein ABW20_dc0106780 [Dactylellina cionopaga]|nr:hypothetical protein ABW20_dc0106780 [Dactylellina cionopaga]
MAEIQPIQRRGERPGASNAAPKKPPPKGTDQKHPAGIFADMATDGPLIGTLVVVVDKAKNLPNLKSIGKQDPYCVLRLGKHVKKTDPDKRGGQTPKWDKELRFPVHDSADYRALKVVIFTDDKKTELIGETLVSLDTILDTSGGGQSDGWHQCKCRGRYAGDVRVEITFWDERPRESAPLVVNTRQITGFEKEDFKRPEKLLAGPRRPGAPPRKRELPEKPNAKPSKEILAPSSPEEEEPPEPPVAQHRKERHREREPRERQREDRRPREHRREKSRHQPREREQERPSHDEYDQDPYHQNPAHNNMPYETPDQYGYYQGQNATLQDFQSDHIGKLQAQYVEQTQLVPHQRHSPNPAAYSGYQNEYYDRQPQWQQPNDQNHNAMVLASQNGPPVLPQHRHVEFVDSRRSMALPSSQPPPQPSHALHHRKSRSEFYSNNAPDLYQQQQQQQPSYNNQLVSASAFAAPPPPPRHHGYDQQYSEQPSYGNQSFDRQYQNNAISQPKPQPISYPSNGGYQPSHQDPYADPAYQSQLTRASDFAPPLPPQHGQAAAYQTMPAGRDDYSNASALVLANSAAPAPPPPTHRNAQPRMSMPASMSAAQPSQPPPVQHNPQTTQPMEMYEQSFQLQSTRGFAPQLPAHGGSHYHPAAPPQPTQLETPDQASPPRPRGNSEPPPYAAITDSTAGYQQPPEPQSFSYAQQNQGLYSTQQSNSNASYQNPPTSATKYTSITDYSQAGTPLLQRLANMHLPQNPEHAFDPTTALVLAGGGPPTLPSHSGTPNSQLAHRGRELPPISTNAPPKRPLSRSSSPHPLSLTPGYGPDLQDDIGSIAFSQHQMQSAEPVAQSNYHAPYVKDVTGRHSMDSRVSFGSTGVSPLIQPASQPLDANRRRSVSPMPPLNTYTQELVSSRGGPPPLPQASHRMSQQLVYKHDPSEKLSENRSNRNSAYDYSAQIQSSQTTHNNNNGILGAQTSDLNSNTASIPVAETRDSKARQPYIEDEIDETDQCADSTYQSASTSWTASQSVDDPSRDYMNRSPSALPPLASYDTHAKQNPSSSMNQYQYADYGNDGMHMSRPGGSKASKPRATSPMPIRRNSDLPPMGRTPDPERQASVRPEQRRMTLGGMPFSPDDYDVINPVSAGHSPSRSPSGNISTMPLARSPGALAMSPGQYMTLKEEKKARKEEEKAMRKARKKVYTPNSANRELAEDDILAPETHAPEPKKRNSFIADGDDDDEDYDDDDRGMQPLSFRPRRQSVSPHPPRGHSVSPQPPRGHSVSPHPPRGHSVSPHPPRGHSVSPHPPRRGSVSPQPPGANIYGTSPGGRGYASGPKSVASNGSSGYGYGAPPPAANGGHRSLPGAPIMRNAIMGPEDYYQQQQGGYGGAPVPARPMQIPQQPPANMTQEQWSLSQELSSINIGSSSRRRTGTWA